MLRALPRGVPAILRSILLTSCCSSLRGRVPLLFVDWDVGLEPMPFEMLVTCVRMRVREERQ